MAFENCQCIFGKVPLFLRCLSVTQALPYCMIEVREYVDTKGRSPYRDWLVKLAAATIARIIGSAFGIR